MKVKYEFMTEIEDDYEDLKIFQKSMEMYTVLIDIKEYLRTLKKDNENNEINNIVENIFDLIFDAEIGEI